MSDVALSVHYLLSLCIMLNKKKPIAARIPIPEHDVIVTYNHTGTDSSSYITYVESRGMFPSVLINVR